MRSIINRSDLVLDTAHYGAGSNFKNKIDSISRSLASAVYHAFHFSMSASKDFTPLFTIRGNDLYEFFYDHGIYIDRYSHEVSEEVLKTLKNIFTEHGYGFSYYLPTRVSQKSNDFYITVE
ncbi:hypothetical protein KNT64_gp040 [Pseudomonas phage PspYZU05]|uniref:Uncharacterized protein n=1 Tax=Pseudomonas phage PspYZU05 TaxID=1983556 RepID=A0A2U7NRX7_9CAUD|nr:hypothetical protein KNT64_gp040 [Pseudomonas phage PspYZU05]ASD51992.1 hypothetical protein PspYZU05_40 [Pseudomonas phage PspYZU05]